MKGIQGGLGGSHKTRHLGQWWLRRRLLALVCLPIPEHFPPLPAGIFHLQRGDHLTLRIPRFNASFDASPHGTFLGLLRL